MIKIRYADLPQGRHAQVRPGGRRPVIYLLPGLSPAQRRDALRRLIRTSRQGYGPRLRATGVAAAVARDAAKSTARTGLAAVRCHPAGSAALAAGVAAAVICYALFVTVTVRFSPAPAGPPAAAGAVPSGAPGAGGPGRSPGGGARGPAAGRLALSVPHGAPSVPGSGPSGSPGPAPSGSAPSGSAPSGSAPSGSAPSGRATSPDPVPTGTWSAPGGVLPTASAGPSPVSSPSPAAGPASPAPPPSGRAGGLCLQLGPLGVCISG